MSGVNIANRTRVGGTEVDLVMQLTSTDLSRTISIGSNWQWIRVGMRFAISGSTDANQPILQPQMAFGMCNGTGSTYTDNNTHFVGVDLDNQYYLGNNIGTCGNNTFFSSQDSVNLGNTRRFVVKTDTIRTVFGTALTDAIGSTHISGSPNRGVCYLDLIKSADATGSIVDPGLWRIRYFYGINSVSTDVSSSYFYAQIQNDTASLTFDTPTTLTEQLVPVTESVYGGLTTINVYWSKSDPPLEISDIAVWRFR